MFRKKSDKRLKREAEGLVPMSPAELELWNALGNMTRHDRDKSNQAPGPRHARMDVGECADGGTLLSGPEE